MIFGSGTILLPIWHQAITRTNADFLPIGALATKFIYIFLNQIEKVLFQEIALEMILERGVNLPKSQWVRVHFLLSYDSFYYKGLERNYQK